MAFLSLYIVWQKKW